MERWHPMREATRHEQFILRRLETKRKPFGFLRRGERRRGPYFEHLIGLQSAN
jgi:hypothetical protein